MAVSQAAAQSKPKTAAVTFLSVFVGIPIAVFIGVLWDSPESGPRGKASGRSRWVFASMATLPTSFAAYSKVPGLTELLRLYVCGLQPRPSVHLSSSRVIANDNEYSHERRTLSPRED